jgi:hypothetical protein
MRSLRSAALSGVCGAVALGSLAAMPAAAVDLNFDYKVNQSQSLGTVDTFATLAIESFAPNTTTFTLDTDLTGGPGNPAIVDLYFGCNGCGSPTFVPGDGGIVVQSGGTQAGYNFDYRVRFTPGVTRSDTPIVWTATAAPDTFLESTPGAGPNAYALIQLTGGAQVLNGDNITSGFYVAAAPGTPTAPIPEPSTYALLLAGLGVVGVAIRRRRQQQS